MKKKLRKIDENLENNELLKKISATLEKFRKAQESAERRDRYHRKFNSDFNSGEFDALLHSNSYNASNDPSTPEQILITQERLDFLYKTIDKVDDTNKKIILGLYFESKTLKQLGAELNMSPVAVRKRKLKTLEKMAQNFFDYYGNDYHL